MKHRMRIRISEKRMGKRLLASVTLLSYAFFRLRDWE